MATKLTSAGIAGFCAAFFSLPFDMLKSRLQDMKPDAEGKMPYSGMTDCAMKVVRAEGPAALWTGFSAYYMRCAPHACIILMTIEQVRPRARARSEIPHPLGTDQPCVCAARVQVNIVYKKMFLS